VAVQGFGNVGSMVAILLSQRGYQVVAVSDSSGGVYDGTGLNIKALVELKQKGAPLSQASGDHISNQELLELPVDILIPAALEGQITSQNASRVQARLIIEGANGPTTPEADCILKENGVTVVPDILANAGGLVVSYFEWVQDLQSFFWDEEEVNERLSHIMRRAFREITSLAERGRMTLREAAMVLAVSRVAEAVRLRGLYP